MTNPTEDALRISFPAKPGFLKICRITTTTFASDLGFDVEELDDLRLAVNEAATWLLKDEAGGGEVTLSLTGDGNELTMTGVRTGLSVQAGEPDDLVHAILGATVDSYELVGGEGSRSVVLTKHRQ